MRKFLAIFLLFNITCFYACIHSQDKKGQDDTVMIRSIDFEQMEKNAQKTPIAGTEGFYSYHWEYKTDQDYEVTVTGDKMVGFVMWQTPPCPGFIRKYAEYDSKGHLKCSGNVIGTDDLRVGRWEYFDADGNQTKEVNEDLRFGKFDYGKLLTFLHLNKKINLETGENRNRLSVFYIDQKKMWSVFITDPSYHVTYYELDGNTGKIIEEREYQEGEE